MAACPSCGRDVAVGMRGNTPKSVVLFYYCGCGNKWFDFVKKESKPSSQEKTTTGAATGPAQSTQARPDIVTRQQ